MVRVSEKAKMRLQRLCKSVHKSQVTLIDEALEVYERQKFLEAIDAGYRALREDKEAWTAHMRDVSAWDHASSPLSPEAE
jgi:predicted transcriptional regulator